MPTLKPALKNPEALLKYLKECMSYDPATGVLTWVKPGRGRPFGKSVGVWVEPRGYHVIAVVWEGKQRKLRVHRVAFALMKNRWPTEVDHINRDKGDNRWSNLREVTRSENCLNAPAQSNSSTGHRGVYLNPYGNYFVHYKGKHVGTYPTLKAAVVARKGCER